LKKKVHFFSGTLCKTSPSFLAERNYVMFG